MTLLASRPVTVHLALLLLITTHPAEASQRSWHSTMPRSGEIIIAVLADNPIAEQANKQFAKHYGYLVIDIRKQNGVKSIRFNPSTDRIILKMQDGAYVEILDLSKEANRIAATLRGRDAVEIVQVTHCLPAFLNQPIIFLELPRAWVPMSRAGV